MKSSYVLANFIFVGLLLGCVVTAIGSLLFGISVDIVEQDFVSMNQIDLAYGVFIAVIGFIFAIIPALISSLCITIIIWRLKTKFARSTGFIFGCLAGLLCDLSIAGYFIYF